MTSDVVVQSGATLTIEPGVEVQAATNGGDTELIVSSGGILVADATGRAEIVFTAQGVNDDRFLGRSPFRQRRHRDA